METLATEEQIMARRRFFLNLSPLQGQHFAHLIGGYMLPSADTQHAENLDVAKLYVMLSESGALSRIADNSWWMLKIMDPQSRFDRLQSTNRSDELVSYAASTIGGLIEDGILTWAKDFPMPDLQIANAPKLDDVEEGVIQRMEKDLSNE